MRRHLASFTAVLATATATLGLYAGAAIADGTATATTPTAAAVATTTAATPTVTAPAVPATTPTAPPKPAPKPKPKPPVAPAAKATGGIYLYDAFFVHHRTLITPGRAMHVTGIVRPYIAGQTATVSAYLGHKLISAQTLKVKRSRNGKYGTVVATVTAAEPGILHLELSHKRNAQMRGFAARRGVAVVDPHVGFGATGPFVQLIQAKLLALHLYIPQTGVYDQQTGLAIDAYHRLMRHGTSQSLDGLTTSEILDSRGAFPVKYPGDGKHVEGNLGLQLLAEINGGKVYAIYPISSGKPSTPTILGRFRVYQRTPGYLPDGMYYSDFFYGGYAIHGYDPAPDYPASHGCMRLPIPDAISVWNWLSIGVPVDVYYP
jgi:hypothetical protein